MTPEPNVPAVIKRLHEMVDDFESTLQFALDNGMFPVVRITFANTKTDMPAYTLVVGFDEPDHEVSDLNRAALQMGPV
jgi:hypothetical protein